jgi:hypothetical protein
MPGDKASEELYCPSPLQPLSGILEVGQAGVGVVPEIEVAFDRDY